MSSKLKLRSVLIACSAMLALCVWGSGCASHTDIEALETRISELESELNGGHASSELDDQAEVAPTVVTPVADEDGIEPSAEEEEEEAVVLAEPEAGEGCEGGAPEAVGVVRPNVTGPGYSVSDSEWLKGDRADPCASPDGCRLTCPEGARLVTQKRAHFCKLSGRKYGPSVSWYDSGMLKNRGNYLGGHKHGTWTAWHPNGRRAGTATHDAKNSASTPSFVSVVETFQERELVETSGQRIFKTEYNDRSELDGLSLHWNVQTGRIEEVSFKAGKRDGLTRIYNSSKTLISEQMFKAGVGHGHLREWRSDGSMALDMTYDNGVPDGRRRVWSSECELSRVGHWKQGKLDGELRTWHSYPNQLMERSHFKGGKRNGMAEAWSINGLLTRKHEHIAGKRHGESSGWHANSQRAFETYWSRGKQDNAVRAWHPSGAPAVIGAYSEGRRLSLGCYDVNGKRAGCRDIKHGIWDEW
jgi:antitoxin component YwqK of YwqJK toxin-antitoxin module